MNTFSAGDTVIAKEPCFGTESPLKMTGVPIAQGALGIVVHVVTLLDCDMIVRFNSELLWVRAQNFRSPA